MASADTLNGEFALTDIRLLPGPDRKKTPREYRYHLIYRSEDLSAAGCVMLWEVTGGRLAYQIAWERTAARKSHLHCTCADAVFRGESEGRYCKHVMGLLARKEKDAA